MIGSEISTQCQKILGKVPEITINTNTRLAFSIMATEDEFNQIIATLPSGWELFRLPSFGNVGEKVYVEMIPSPIRDPLAEIDKLKARVEKLEGK